MKNLLVCWTGLGTVTGGVYLFLAFSELSFDVTTWEMASRVIFGLVALVCSLAAIVAACSLMKEDNSYRGH